MTLEPTSSQNMFVLYFLLISHAIHKLYPEADCIQMIELIQTIRTIVIYILSVNLFVVASSLCLGCCSGITSDVLA